MPPQRNDIRNDIRTTACPVCAETFTPNRRQRYCTPACRQTAWRTRHHDRTLPPPRTLPPATPRRQMTVYECSQCSTRQLGQQWCHECNRPAVRIDLGGLCPHCDEPITISDLTDQYPHPEQASDQHEPDHPTTHQTARRSQTANPKSPPNPPSQTHPRAHS
jgi:hypothetical protein